MVKQAIKFGAAFGASIMLMGSVASAATITITGPGSVNKIVKSSSNSSKKNCKVTNKNNVMVANSTVQKGKTGKAKVGHNTTASGDAVSGDVTNDNSTTLGVDVANNNVVDPCGGCGCEEVPVDTDTISNTGPGSWNMILSGGNCGCNSGGITVKNVNNVVVANSTFQSGKTGNASVWGNTSGGSATSGSANNTNTSDIVVTVSNN